MPAPIMPAPTTPTFLNSVFGYGVPSACRGREPPPLQWFRSKKNACIMFFDCEPVTSSVK